MRKISITEALVELKLYDEKINKAINSSDFVNATKKSNPNVGVIRKEDFIKRAKASYQSITDYISNRNALKSAIVLSNAISKVNINGKNMTVAEVIDRKNSIEYEKKLLNKMKEQYTLAINKVQTENFKVDAKVGDLLNTLIGKESSKKITKEEQEAIEIPYREKNEFELVDPIEIYDKITKLENEIDGFLSNCDTQLVLSNSTTFIEVNF